MNYFKRPTFLSPSFMVESSDTPKIKPGGSSSSNLLNRFHTVISKEILLLLNRTNQLAARSQRVESIVSSTAGALLAQFQSLSTRVDQASGYSQILCDMHQSTYIDTGLTTAELDYEYGQATLPIQTTTDLLTQVDLFGETQVSSEIELSYSTTSNPESINFIADPEGIYMLRREQKWLISEVASGTTLWTKIKAPLQYRGLTPNVIELRPLSPFSTDLLEVSYQEMGDSYTGVWTSVDLSYLPMYSMAGNKVTTMPPLRIHLPNVPISQIRIKQVARMDTVWGWDQIRVLHTEYANQGTLVVKDPYSRTISTPLLRGKDTSELAQLGIEISASQASINLTTTNSGLTPVITGVILSV